MLINGYEGPAGDDEEDDDSEDVIITGDDAEVVDKANKANNKGGKAAEDDDDDVTIEEDERPAHQQAMDEDDGLTDEQRRDKKRKERRDYRHRKRLRERQNQDLIKGLQETVANQNKRLQELEGGRQTDQISRIDAALNGANNRVTVLKAKIKQAGEEGNFDQQAELVDELTIVRADIGKIEEVKATAAEALKKRKEQGEKDDGAGGEDGEQQQTRRTAKTPEWDQQTVLNNTKTFVEKFPWFKVNEKNDDSDLVRQLDAALTAEGSRPDTAEHWIELEERIKEELPHRFSNGRESRMQERADNRNGRRPVVSSGNGRNNGRDAGNGGKGFLLSKDRVAAMKEAGIWDDPAAKKRQIEYYKKYDKDHAADGRSN